MTFFPVRCPALSSPYQVILTLAHINLVYENHLLVLHCHCLIRILTWVNYL